MIECTVDGCQRKHVARGFCNAHYFKFRISGKIDKIDLGICKVDDCKQPAYSKGYCSFHYQRNRVGKSFDHAYYHGEFIPCSVEGCNEKHHALKYCRFHYFRARMNIDFSLKKKKYKPYKSRTVNGISIATIAALNNITVNAIYYRIKRGKPFKTE